MATFVSRVTNYPIVGDTFKVATDTYNWIKSKNGIGSIVQTAEEKASSIVKPIVDSEIGRKADNLACQLVLDPVESVCSHIKSTSTDLIITPAAGCALSVAETCADLWLPEDKNPEHQLPENPTHAQRLSRLQTRTSDHTMVLLRNSIERAHTLLKTLTTYGSNFRHSVSTATIKNVLGQVASLYELAYASAKSVGVPLLTRYIGFMLEQVHKLQSQLKESNTLNWVDLQKLIGVLDHLRSALDESQRPPEIELKPIPKSNYLHKLNIAQMFGY